MTKARQNRPENVAFCTCYEFIALLLLTCACTHCLNCLHFLIWTLNDLDKIDKVKKFSTHYMSVANRANVNIARRQQTA